LSFQSADDVVQALSQLRLHHLTVAPEDFWLQSLRQRTGCRGS
jgi:hypothetical protein